MPKVDKSDYKPHFEIDISKSYGPSERQAIAQEIIDYIVERTEKGLDADNRAFVKYKSNYAKEKGQSNVDLTFSGDMLAEIQLLQDKSGKIRIGFSGDYDGLGKVEGNILGTYGQDSPVNKGRNFLGITKADLNAILANYSTKEDAETTRQVGKVAERIARNIDQEDLDDDSD